MELMGDGHDLLYKNLVILYVKKIPKNSSCAYNFLNPILDS
jgi:hypothetical protein